MKNQVIIADRLALAHQQILMAEKKYSRLPGSIQLLAVSKNQSQEAIIAAYQAGQRCFGENYVQEAVSKIKALEKFSIEWHFIGKLQANKTQLVASFFSWVHSLDCLKLAKRLNAQRPPHLPKLNVCIQVNLEEEPGKGGIVLQELRELAEAIQTLQNLSLRGLMIIPKPHKNFADQINIFKKMQNIQENLCQQGLKLDTLSMGMSQDFEAAIACGSTIIRLGTAIFGPRE